MNFRLSLLLCLATALTASAQTPTTGWLQTVTGTYDYNDPLNWVGGNINGVWSPGLTLASGNHILNFSSNTVAVSGLRVAYSGDGNLYLRPGGVHRTLTLADDLVFATASNRTLTFGQDSNAQTLLVDIDLAGGTRKMDIRGNDSNNRTVNIYDIVRNGAIVAQGGGVLNFNNTASTTALEIELASLRLKNIHATAQGSSNMKINGPLVLDGESGCHALGYSGGISFLNIVPKTSSPVADNHVSAKKLEREHGGVVLFRGDRLGGGISGAMTPKSSVLFDTAPTLVGGNGAAGSKTISILPGALWTASQTTRADSFVTYDSTRGIRPLDPATEFATNIVSGTISSNNVYLNPAPVAVNTNLVSAPTTINSLFIYGSLNAATNVYVTGPGPLRITSGLVYMFDSDPVPQLRVPIDFGSAQGIFANGNWQRALPLYSPIHGSNGVVFCQTYPYARADKVSHTIYAPADAASTYTGDTFVLGHLTTGSGFLPSGTRTGDVFVYGVLQANDARVNGLSGGGCIYKYNTGTGYVDMGDNNANGDFWGLWDQAFTTANATGSQNIRKNGAGIQRLGGWNKVTPQTNGNIPPYGNILVNAGTLILDGAFTNASVTVNAGTTLRGAGVLNFAHWVDGVTGKSLTFKSGSLFAPGGAAPMHQKAPALAPTPEKPFTGILRVLNGNVIFENGAALEIYADKKLGFSGLSVTNGKVAGQGASVSITASGTLAGRWLVIAADGGIEPSFQRRANGVIFTLENNGTELWAERPSPGSLLIAR